jgi:hypothetical protein
MPIVGIEEIELEVLRAPGRLGRGGRPMEA